MKSFGAFSLRLFMCVALLAAVGCNRDVSLSVGAPTAPTNPNNPPPEEPTIEVSGHIVNGPLEGATVKVFDGTGALVGEAATNAAGFYSLQVASQPPYLIEVIGGSLEGQPYAGSLQASCATAEPCNATPFTTAVTQLMNEGGFNEDEAAGLLNARTGIDYDPFIRHYVESETVVGFDLDNARLFIDGGEQLEVWVAGVVEWATAPIEEQQAPAGIVYHHSVTASAGEGGSIGPVTEGEFQHGSVVSFSVTPDFGYHLLAVDGCSGSLEGNVYTTGPISSACEVSASFALISYAISAVAGTGGTVTPVSQPATHGQAVVFALEPAPGYSVATVNGCEGTLEGTTFTTAPLAQACTLEASFSLNSYTVSTSARAGGTITPALQTVAHGSATSFTLQPAEGYSIMAVSGCAGELKGNRFTTGEITGACTVSASFIRNRYTVSASAGTGGAISPASQNLDHGSSATLTVTPDAGYSIASVSGCGGTLSGNTFTTGGITGACHVAASFSLNAYTVSASAGTGGSISPATQSIDHGSTATLTVTAGAGYSISSVSGCDGILAGSTFTTAAVTEACSITASFRVNSYSVTASAGVGGNITPATHTVEHGGSTTFSVTPDAGYSIATVSGCGGTLSGNIFTTGSITGACHVAASFSLNTYTVSASAGTGGSISPATQSIDHGSTATLTVTADAGYNISSVSGCDGILAGSTFTTAAVTEACSITASFQVNSYSVTASAGVGGNITPATHTVEHGGSTTFSVTPDAGYSIDTVAGCNGALSDNIFTTGAITEACSITANFSLNSYSVTASAGAGGSITPATDTVEHGGIASFTIARDAGYSIDDISGCSGVLARDVYTTGAVTEPCHVTVSFSLNSYEVSATAGAGGGIAPASARVAHGSTTAFTLTPDTGYSIDAVSGCGGTLDGNTFTTGAITEACSIIASFNVNTYSVATSAGAGGSITPEATTVAHGSTASFTIAPEAGYSIDEISGCSGTLADSTYTTGAVTEPCHVTVSFSLNSYEVSATAGAGGGIVPASARVAHGSTTAFTLTPDTGYSIDAVSGCGGTLDGNTFTTGAITEACSIIASFNVNTYSVATSAGTGGSISPASRTVAHGSAASFAVAPASGFAIDSVSGCAGSLDGSTYTTGAITEGCTITASFAVSLTAPANVAASAGSEQVTLTWDAVANAYDYDIVFATESFDAANPSLAEGYDVESSVAESPHTLTGLTSGTQYYFAINGNTQVGNMDGPPSALVAATPTASCYGLDASSPLVCGGNGTCTAADTCSCNAGFEGAQCQTPTAPSCFGVSATEVANVCSGKGVCTSTDTCACDPFVIGSQCNVDLKFSDGTIEHHFPTTTGKYSIIDGPELPAGETYVWKFEILATGFWPGQQGFTVGVAGYPLAEPNFHELGQFTDEWSFRGRDGRSFAEGAISSFGSPFRTIGDQIMIELDTVAGAMNVYIKRVGESEFTLEGGRAALTDVFPKDGRVLRPAVSTVCWQPCGIKFIE